MPYKVSVPLPLNGGTHILRDYETKPALKDHPPISHFAVPTVPTLPSFVLSRMAVTMTPVTSTLDPCDQGGHVTTKPFLAPLHVTYTPEQ